MLLVVVLVRYNIATKFCENWSSSKLNSTHARTHARVRALIDTVVISEAFFPLYTNEGKLNEGCRLTLS
jgi:hypothetical protein